jgi:hypothetical protein
MIGKIPCSAKAIPCFRAEQAIPRNALDLQLDLLPNDAKTGPRRPIFRKYPDHFPVFREKAALPQAASVGTQSLYCANAAAGFPVLPVAGTTTSSAVNPE